MNTRYRFQAVLAATVSALVLSAGASGGPLSDVMREAKGDADSSASSAPAPRQSAPRQSAPRQSAPRQSAPSAPAPSADRGGNRGQSRSDRGPVGGVIERNYERRDGGSYQGNRRPPRYVPSLPGGYRQYNWNGRPYYNHGGNWYRPYGNRYAVVGAPYGLFVDYLPGYYNSFWFGSTRYYYADDTYYVYEPARRGYVVSRSPYGDDRDDEEYPDADNRDEDLFVYPARGQSEQQQADDRYECHRWAADQTQYDPVDSDYDADQRADYLRAMTACLTGRGYSVK